MYAELHGWLKMRAEQSWLVEDARRVGWLKMHAEQSWLVEICNYYYKHQRKYSGLTHTARSHVYIEISLV